MTPQELAKKAGGVTALARLLGISCPAIYQWKTIPQARLWQLKTLKPEWFEENKPTCTSLEDV
jgi:hypothetical protein